MTPEKEVRPLDNVFWYPQGDVNNEGCIAVVHNNDGRGGLKLAILKPLVQTVTWLSGVRNVKDPLLQERRQVALNVGAWESRAQYEERMAELELAQEENRRIAAKLKAEEFARRQAAVKGLKDKKKEAVA